MSTPDVILNEIGDLGLGVFDIEPISEDKKDKEEDKED